MQRLFRLVLPSLLWLAVFLCATLRYGYAAQAISSVSAVPDGIPVNTMVMVAITAKIASDPTLIPGSVNLVSYDAQGLVISTVSRLYDEGTHGDKTASDNIFTIQLQLNQPATGQLFFKVSAAYRGRLTRILSQLITVDVVQPPSTAELLTIAATNQSASDLFTLTASTQGLSAARSALIKLTRQ